MGQALGEECRRENVAVLLGPGVNIKRSPLCGRNFEYLSEDPLLSGKLAAALIRGAILNVMSDGLIDDPEIRATSISARTPGRSCLFSISIPCFTRIRFSESSGTISATVPSAT